MNIKEFLKNHKKTCICTLSTIIFLGLCAGAFVGYNTYKQKQEAQIRSQKIQEEIENNRAAQGKKPSQYKFGMEYNQALKQDKPVVVLFYADWCRFCIKFMPVLEKVAKTYKDEINFAQINVEDEKYQEEVNNFGIGGFPTVYILDPKYDAKILLSGYDIRDKESIGKEIDRYLNIRHKLDKK